MKAHKEQTQNTGRWRFPVNCDLPEYQNCNQWKPGSSIRESQQCRPMGAKDNTETTGEIMTHAGGTRDSAATPGEEIGMTDNRP